MRAQLTIEAGDFSIGKVFLPEIWLALVRKFVQLLVRKDGRRNKTSLLPFLLTQTLMVLPIGRLYKFQRPQVGLLAGEKLAELERMRVS